MRRWTLHPSCLDTKGLLAVWREALLAQKVLAGNTSGYRQHPQLVRFQAHPDPLQAIGAFLLEVADEARQRHYNFNAQKIISPRPLSSAISATDGQLLFEQAHLLEKLRVRDPARAMLFAAIKNPRPHPLFVIVSGPIQSWEKGVPPPALPPSA